MKSLYFNYIGILASRNRCTFPERLGKKTTTNGIVDIFSAGARIVWLSKEEVWVRKAELLKRLKNGHYKYMAQYISPM